MRVLIYSPVRLFGERMGFLETTKVITAVLIRKSNQIQRTSEAQGVATRMADLKQLGAEVRNSISPVVLVLASLFAAVAAVAQLTAWVSVAAAIAALISGVQVLRAELLIPLRIRSAENSTVVVAGWDQDKLLSRGTAFHLAPDRWLTAAHVLRESTAVRLRIGGAWELASVVYRNEDHDVAVLHTQDSSFEFKASYSHSIPDSGEKVRIVGWTRQFPDPALRLAFDYLVQGPAEDGLIALTGEGAQLGFSGAPAINLRTGRVFGVFLQYLKPKAYDEFGPEPIAVVLIRPVTDVPPAVLKGSR